IYNATGQLVKSISANGASEVRLDVSEWPSGVYFVEGTIGNGLKRSGRFVK
ncbi:MAG: T9SS type A sorting domain-containing protein, partial [Bacteroidales bacterium]|nr:T9SS type A sorting domain-containing protein [Bacteroidales bacterium]